MVAADAIPVLVGQMVGGGMALVTHQATFCRSGREFASCWTTRLRREVQNWTSLGGLVFLPILALPWASASSASFSGSASFVSGPSLAYLAHVTTTRFENPTPRSEGKDAPCHLAAPDGLA
jgi:hypothetical protein